MVGVKGVLPAFLWAGFEPLTSGLGPGFSPRSSTSSFLAVSFLVRVRWSPVA